MAALLCALLSVEASAEETYVSGHITNLTSTTAGIMIMMSGGVPGNCAGTPYGWMLIPETSKAMVAMALAMWASGRTGASVYTHMGSGGYCVIDQLDPHE